MTEPLNFPHETEALFRPKQAVTAGPHDADIMERFYNGSDTLDISEALGVSQSYIANRLAELRDAVRGE